MKIFFNMQSFLLTLSLSLPSLANAAEKELSASEILAKIDGVMFAAKDQTCEAKLILIDKDGKEKTRDMAIKQKGTEKRLVRFLSPADQRGISFLSLPNDMLYLYMPAFGKVRRIASHVKNTSFAGTDSSYEDMESVPWVNKWSAKIDKREKDTTILVLTILPGKTTDYSKVVVTVRNDNFIPIRMEHFDKAGKLYKIAVREKIEKMDNKYWIAQETTMENVQKQHKTKMVMSNIKFDKGLSENDFSERALSQQ